MLGDPEPLEPELVGAPRQSGRVGEGTRRISPIGHHGEIEDGTPD